MPATSQPGTSPSVREFYAGLRPICVGGLRQALNPQTAIYDRQLRARRWEATRGTEDLTSTCICLIGVHRAAVDPNDIGLDVKRTLEATQALYRQREYFGGIGLLIWANAVWGGAPLAGLLHELGVSPQVLSGPLDALTTMESAWLASGLLHECERNDRQAPELARCALGALKKRYVARTRTMMHASAAGPFGHRLRRNVANFADQIYSVQAMAFAEIVLGEGEADRCSAGLARHMVELQGSKGQWWWHYDARDGGVAQAYSVYSVHQHGMAPMALSAVTAARGEEFTGAANRSRSWLTNNELDLRMIDTEAGTIWRSIDYAEGFLAGRRRLIRSLLGWKRNERGLGAGALKLNCETRPYEWAWCLYAGAIECAQDRRTHIV